MDISACVTAIINRLGYVDEDEYKPDPDCFHSIRELIQFLRRDDKSYSTRRCMLSQNLVRSDLLRILLLPNVDEQLFEAALRLCLNLLTPVYVLAENRNFDDEQGFTAALREIDEALQRCVVSFASEDFFSVIAKKIRMITSKTNDDLTEEDKIGVERFFALLRHIFSISAPVIPSFSSSKCDRAVQDKLVYCYLKSGIDNDLVQFATNQRTAEFMLPVFSIRALILNRFDPNTVAKASEPAIIPQKKPMTEEERKRLARLAVSSRPQRPPGRSFLGGTYKVEGLKAINSKNDFVVTKPVDKDDIMASFDDRKGTKAVARNRRITADSQAASETATTPEYILFEVKRFLLEILPKSFRKLMRYVTDMAFDSSRSTSNKYSDRFYFIIYSFMFRFCRAICREDFMYPLNFNKEFVHMIMTKVDYYFDSMKTDKENVKKYVIDAQHAINCFEGMLVYLKYLGDDLKSENEALYYDICSYIFEMQECREMAVNIMTGLAPTTVSLPMLHSLIIVNEYYMFLIERENKRGRLKQVKTKKKIRRKKVESKNSVTVENEDDIPELQKEANSYARKYSKEELEEIWNSITIDLEDIISGVVEPPDVDINPIDYSVPVKDDMERQMFAILKIRKALRESKPAEAIGLYKAAQAFWSSEGDAFAEEMKLNNFKEFMFLDSFDEAIESFQKAIDSIYDKSINEEEYEEVEMEENEEYEEIDFHIADFLEKLSHSNILQWYFFILANFETNSNHVNMSIIKFFKRIWLDLNSPAKLYDVRLFKIFTDVNKVFRNMKPEEQKLHKCHNLYIFAIRFAEEFFKSFSARGSMLINELWTCKTSREAFEIQEGYDAFDPKTGKGQLWTEELENEMTKLYEEYMAFDDKPEGIDVVDFINKNLSQQREDKQIVKRLRQLGYSVKHKKNHHRTRKLYWNKVSERKST